MRNFFYLVIGTLIAFLLFFYRYPFWLNLQNVDERAVSSPAYGTIMDIRKEDNGDYYIAIFLSPLDIHYQFAPITGEIIDKKYDATGKFELAYELNKSHQNEKAIYTIRSKRGDFKVFQIAGKLVRRISTFCQVGQQVNRGDPLGLIHFGSRVDIIIPNPKNDFQIGVKNGDKVSPDTILGYYH
jgi:phosphatidylserine decarboxylase